MRRIGLAVILALAVSLLLAPILAEAQEARRVRVGWLAPEHQSFALDPFLHAMKELGWTRKLPRQVDTSKIDSAGVSGLGRNVSGGTRPRLSWGRSVL